MDEQNIAKLKEMTDQHIEIAVRHMKHIADILEAESVPHIKRRDFADRAISEVLKSIAFFTANTEYEDKVDIPNRIKNKFLNRRRRTWDV